MLRVACVLATTALTTSLGATPIPDTDPFLPGTKWVGTLTQKGTFRGGVAVVPAFQTVLTVTHRNGDRFEADLAEEAEPILVTYQVNGVIRPVAGGKGHTVQFRSAGTTRALGTVPVLGVPYEGQLTGRALRGTWKAPGRGGANVEGDFALELAR